MKRYVREFANDRIKYLKDVLKIPPNETTTQERREALISKKIERVKRAVTLYEDGRITGLEAMRLVDHA